MQALLLEDLRARIAQADLSAYEAELLPHVRLAFDLHLNGASQGELGESRWGGVPDVPSGFEWPHLGSIPMAFLAQINLADLIRDEENPFPSSGLLQFFADMTDNAPRVVLVDVSQPLHPAEPLKSESEWDEMPPHRLTITPRADLPQWATSDYNEATRNMSEDEQTGYGDAFNLTEGARPGREFAGQLLGHVAGIGYDPREGAVEGRELEGGSFEHDNPAHQAAAKRWRNLAMFDSIRSLDFTLGDAGYFGFLVHEDDLKKLDFSRVYAMLQSS